MARVALLHLVNEFAYVSTTRRLLNLIQGLDQGRYEIHVGCVKRIGGPMADDFRAAGVAVVNFAAMSGWLNLDLIPAIIRYISANSISLVHTHALRADFMGGLAVWLMRRRPVLLATKGNTAYNPSQKGWLARNLIYWPAMYFPDKVITVSKALRQQILSALHFDSDRVIAIQTGIAVEDFYKPEARHACREQWGLAPEDFVMAYVGRLVTGKGLDDLLHALRQLLTRHERAYLFMVGEGPLQSPLQRLAEDLGIASHVIWTGFRRDIPEILAATDVFVLPSLTEGLPQSVMEAMAACKAVVATDVGGIPELVEPGVTGLIVPPRDRVALAQALSQLLDDQRREDMARQAQRHARERFSIPQMVSAYDSLYQTCLRQRV